MDIGIGRLEGFLLAIGYVLQSSLIRFCKFCALCTSTKIAQFMFVTIRPNHQSSKFEIVAARNKMSLTKRLV